jgi:hypothetical protein
VLAALILLLASLPVAAQELLPNGDFESGTLDGWTVSRLNRGVVNVVGEGTCFSDNDTTYLQIPGNYAAAVRSSDDAPLDSIGVLTSDVFTAGDGVLFRAISETRAERWVADPVDFDVLLLDANNQTLFQQRVTTALVGLHPGCPSAPNTGGFSTHYVDTRPWQDQEVRIQFRQNTGREGVGFFTLVDDVYRYPAGQAPVFPGQPVAVAGTSLIEDPVLPYEFLNLDARLSADPDGQNLSYRWFIDGETTPREGETVPVDDLENGNHTAVLVVSDGLNVATDTLRFAVFDTMAVSEEQSGGTQ